MEGQDSWPRPLPSHQAVSKDEGSTAASGAEVVFAIATMNCFASLRRSLYRRSEPITAIMVSVVVPVESLV